MQKKVTTVPVVCIWEGWHLICSPVVKWHPESSLGWHSLAGFKGMAMASLCIQQLQEFRVPSKWTHICRACLWPRHFINVGGNLILFSCEAPNIGSCFHPSLVSVYAQSSRSRGELGMDILGFSLLPSRVLTASWVLVATALLVGKMRVELVAAACP